MPKFKIGALAAAAGVKPDTIRYYERLGLLNAPGRTRSGYRMYDGDVLDRLLFIRSIQELGFTLEQARTLLGANCEASAGIAELLGITRTKLRAARSQLGHLRKIEQALARLAKLPPASRSQALWTSLRPENNSAERRGSTLPADQ